MRILSDYELKKGDFRPNSIARAKTLQVVKDYETAKHVAFKVVDPVSGSKHLVFYKSEKKPPLDWSCDCEWYITRNMYCAHILAVHLSNQPDK